MPVKWTSEMDQKLLLKILETHELRVNTEKVSEAWFGDDLKAKPTPRAIAERLVKIKSLIKNGNGTTPASTPKKLATPSSHNRAFGKRKRRDTREENITTENFIWPTSDIRTIKHEHANYSDSSIDGMVIPMSTPTPSKRARVAPSLPAGMITYTEDTDDGAQYESSTSEFIPSAKIEVSNGYSNVHDDEAVGTAECV
ncbi:hypothetical protein AJ78_04094 [Emergomyces pasteurianus Ep9510]|uniref:Uncharacterized protein n=1 Tax=Emergomyces pasteurianus Ep9510 TaxID=1447872 RepID=A0A1J9QIF7_9EURO|nr:hypothetical protein AJ78_04094 [Emergomyces pasteurianus Ep9510]